MKQKSCIIAAAFFLLVGIILLLTPSFTSHPPDNSKIISETHLRIIVLASIIYADDFDGRLPESFSVLVPNYIEALRVFFPRKNDRSNKALSRKIDDLSESMADKLTAAKRGELNFILQYQSAYKMWKASETECIFHERPGLWKHGRILWQRIEFDGESWKKSGQGELEEDEIAEFLSDPAIARAKSSK